MISDLKKLLQAFLVIVVVCLQIAKGGSSFVCVRVKCLGDRSVGVLLKEFLEKFKLLNLKVCQGNVGINCSLPET